MASGLGFDCETKESGKPPPFSSGHSLVWTTEAYTSAMVCSGWERRQDGEELQSPPGVSVSTGPASWVLGPGDLSSAL